MPTTKDEIRSWLTVAKDVGATHVVMVCDTFVHADYPVRVYDGQSVRDCVDHYNGRNMQKVMEVYRLDMDIEKQLNERRAFNF